MRIAAIATRSYTRTLSILSLMSFNANPGVNGAAEVGTTSKRKRASETKFYTVRSGHRPGIYNTWAECLEQVKGFKGAVFKSFPTLTDAEKFLNGEDPMPNSGSKQTYKFYAVRSGKIPGIYTDWPSAQKQITGWSKPVHKCFSTKAEAQRFLEGDGANDDLIAQLESAAKKIKKGGKGKEAADFTYEPGVGLPFGAEDGFDSNILLQAGTGNVIIKSRAQKAATKLHATGPVPGGMIRVYTDGSALGNGKVGAFAGVGVFFGPLDHRNVSEGLPGTRQTNQRAELQALVRALDVLPRDQHVTLVTDSTYAIKCATDWSKNWAKNGWKAANGKLVENRDIVETLLSKVAEREAAGTQTLFEWIKGHDNNPGNIEADKLAVEGARYASNMSATD